MARKAGEQEPGQQSNKGGQSKSGGTGPSQPNILVIWGDDIGQSNLSCYTHGLMGYRTPNIDRIATEGMLFTDSYGEQSCTAGRSSFITGQSVYRTGLSKVGIPAAPVGMSEKLVTIAALLKEQGYATGQFGKNHLGDLNEHAADQPRLRRVLRQPVPPQCRGRAGDVRLPLGEGLPELPEDVRSAGRHPLLGHRHGRQDGDGTLGQGGQAEDQGHRPAHHQADGDLRRRVRRRRHRLHQEAEPGRQAMVRLAQHHPHAPVHAHQEAEPGPGRPVAVALSRHHDRPRQERGPDARPARPARHRRRHLRSCTRPTTGRTGTAGPTAA